MTKDGKETLGKPEEKEPRDKSDKKDSCGCGCVPPIETK
jgi:hypothetical protein